jgi:hypothetical protein
VRNTSTTQQERCRIDRTKIPQAQQWCRAERSLRIGVYAGKNLPRTSLQCSYIFLVLSAILSVENRVPLKPVLGAWGMLRIFIFPHVQTQSNRGCNSLVILLWLMVPRDHFVSRFLLLLRLFLGLYSFDCKTASVVERLDVLSVICRLHNLRSPFKIIAFYLVPPIVFSFSAKAFFYLGTIRRFSRNGTTVSHWRFHDNRRMNTSADFS